MRQRRSDKLCLLTLQEFMDKKNAYQDCDNSLKNVCVHMWVAYRIILVHVIVLFQVNAAIVALYGLC